MAYTALYRKFRPTEFGDVKGQDHIVKTLRNQIKSDRVGHAYLFCGTRGTGKTTIAKILAKAVNCENPIDGNPCNECSMCKAINSQNSMNVIEIDAASNNGVDNIRDIIEEVQYSPTQGRYKVYIIDEVHMLSAGAFNALLKTLEEPPSYVIFILATTEVHKIPVTILSRCQRYDFKRITIDIISERIKELLEKEQVEAEEKAIRYIAKSADGALRDALSLLDQCMAFYFGEKLTYDNVLNVLGAVDTHVFSTLLRLIIAGQVTQAMELVERLIIEGRELGQFVVDFTWYLRNLLLVKTSDAAEDIIDISSDNLVELKENAESIDAERLMRYIRIFSDLANQVKYASQKRVLVEIAIIKLCRPQMEQNYDSILDRLSIIEEKLEKGIVVNTTGSPSNPQAVVSEINEEEQAEKISLEELQNAVTEEVRQVAQNWRTIISNLHGSLKPMLLGAKLSIGSDNQLILLFSEEVDKDYVDKEGQKEAIEMAIAEKIGKKVVIRTKLIEAGNDKKQDFPDLTKIFKNVDIEYEN
ncbi:DNA polymerase III subunit gamma/tau [Anaerosporobacter faecicola]|uniref:DNA polymerase III subunit gamma/tau n=1 Tax=Anaerosporobacter faecicola TaxID=2718714 RepID=UPI0014389F30|nr:DNA polymerase III subunit gamma/tau [Anaerosporobacter faecicola]